MDNKKSNTGLVVTIVVLVMIILFGGTLFVLSSMGYLNFEKEEVKDEENIDDVVLSNDQKYGYIIEDYRKYVNDFNYTSENINFIDTNIASESDFFIGYVYYDLDSNSIDELLISRIDSNGKYLSIIDVYTLNDNNVIKILDESGVCQRCGIDIWNNGLLFYKGSGGSDHGYLNFYNVSASEKQVVDRYMYELDENLNYSVYQIDGEGTKISNRLSYSSEEQLVSYYKKNASNLSFDGVVFNKIK